MTIGVGSIVLAWGLGWAVAAVLFPLSVYVVDPQSSVMVFAAALAVGGALVGAPTYVMARQAQARFPLLEAGLWVLLFAVMVLIFVRITVPPFEAVNSVTTEDMRRGPVNPFWPWPPELVWGLRCAAAFCVLAGFSSALVNIGAVSSAQRLMGLVWRAPLFIAGIAISFAVAVVIFVLGGPFVWRVIPFAAASIAAAGFVPGCVAGAGILAMRRVFLRAA
jgi:hypothetical protein